MEEKKILPATIAFLLIFNSLSGDYAFSAQSIPAGASTLTAPLNSDDLGNVDSRDRVRIDMALQNCLKPLCDSLPGINVTRKTLKDLGTRSEDILPGAAAPNISDGARIQLFFREARINDDGERNDIVVMCRVCDIVDGARSGPLRTYYASFPSSLALDADGGIPITFVDKPFEPTKHIIVPRGYHPDLREEAPSRSGSYRYDGGSYSIQPRLVPRDPKRIYTPGELVETGTLKADGQKRVVVAHDNAMTNVSADILTSIMKSADYAYTIGLATGGTTEALRKLMGLADMLENLYGRGIDGDKIKKICTLDNYYFMDYLAEKGITGEEADLILSLASYESEQLYMMIKNMMGGDVAPDFFLAPPSLTNLSWFDSAKEFRLKMMQFFFVSEFVKKRETATQLWQLHGIGSNSHDAFNDIYTKVCRDRTDEIYLELFSNRKVKRALLQDGLDLAKFGDITIPESLATPDRYLSMGMMRPDYASMIKFIIQVQNAGHFIPRKFHPFFLKFMADNSLYDLSDLITGILSMTEEKLLSYTDDPKYHFPDIQTFVNELEYLLEQYSNVPVQSTTQGTGDIVKRGSVMLPDGSYTLQLFMASAAHKQLGVLRALALPGQWSTASWVLHLAKNSLLVATEESLGMVTDIDTYNTFIKVEPTNESKTANLGEEVEKAWKETSEGKRVEELHRRYAGEDAPQDSSNGPSRERIVLPSGDYPGLPGLSGLTERDAMKVGIDMPTLPDQRYNIILPSEFFAPGNEYSRWHDELGDRCDLIKANNILSNSDPDDAFNSIAAAVREGQEARTIALLPAGISDANLEKLRKLGVRFVVADKDMADRLLTISYEDRSDIIMDTVTVLRLLRRADEEMVSRKYDPVYRILKFYVLARFELTDSITADEYIEAVVRNDDTARLLRAVFKSDRMIPHNARDDYDKLNAAVTFA